MFMISKKKLNIKTKGRLTSIATFFCHKILFVFKVYNSVGVFLYPKFRRKALFEFELEPHIATKYYKHF